MHKSINYKPDPSKCFPRWNYKKAEWKQFSKLSDKYTKSLKTDDRNINRLTADFNKAILKSAAETIPPSARKKNLYWADELREIENEVSKCKQEAEVDPTIEHNIALKASSAK